jgi:hypothetical protein
MLRAVGAWPVTRGLELLLATREIALPFAATVVFFVVPFAVVVPTTPFAAGFFAAADAAPGLAFAAAALLAGEAALVAVADVSSASNCAQGQSNRPSNAQPRNFAHLLKCSHSHIATTPLPVEPTIRL